MGQCGDRDMEERDSRNGVKEEGRKREHGGEGREDGYMRLGVDQKGQGL